MIIKRVHGKYFISVTRDYKIKKITQFQSRLTFLHEKNDQQIALNDQFYKVSTTYYRV